MAAGFASFPGIDDAFIFSKQTGHRNRIPGSLIRPLIVGDNVRDWCAIAEAHALAPYDCNHELIPWTNSDAWASWLWPLRTVAQSVISFGGKTRLQLGQPWWGWYRWISSRYRIPLSFVFAFVSTHVHFALDRGGNVFKQTSPIVKLPETATEADYLALLGIINSSLQCFWLRQVCRNKGTGGIGGGLATERWEQFFEFDSTNVSQLPLPAEFPSKLATAIQSAADERSTLLPAAITAREVLNSASLTAARHTAQALLLRMIALQEELDWHVYHLYGLIDESLTLPIDQVPPVQLGERAFEIVMARAMESGELETEWFARHGSTPRTSIPEHWPAPYRALVQRRLDVIARDRDIALIEQPEYKRRWNLPAWKDLEKDALRNWLLDRLEDARYWPAEPPALTSVARLADAVRLDPDFLQVAALYRGREDFDLLALVQELVAKESVPFVPVLRYKESGLRKHQDWERTWDLQRQEDRGEKVEIPVPPKYERDDFLSADFWRLRGKLDVPKERFISYPHLERDADKSLVIAWAGYDHGQQALALASYCYEMRGNEAWTAERLTPILAGLQELQPWLDQWHAELDPSNQQRLNESIRTFFESELTQLEMTAEQVRAWHPPARARRGASAGNKK